MQTSVCPRLAITLGDPAGIGPEVVLKALAVPIVNQGCQLTVIGSRSVLNQAYTRLCRWGGNLQSIDDHAVADPEQLAILDCDRDGSAAIIPGMPSQASGAASFNYMEQAITQTLAGQFDGIVTAPIAKSAWKAAGHAYAGQTELLAKRSGVNQFGMLFVARSPYTGWTLRTLLATTHIPLRRVADTLTPELLSRKLELLVRCLAEDFGLATPEIAIAGLNPHSGEQGQLGSEEQDWLIPWLEEERSRRPKIKLEGPVPPDTLWVKPAEAWHGSHQAPRPAKPISAHDGYLALYHDQGLIPVKLLAFDQAVNTTIGLPFIRTSPDHGTAFDIAGRGIAKATSIVSAIQLAKELVCQKQVASSIKA